MAWRVASMSQPFNVTLYASEIAIRRLSCCAEIAYKTTMLHVDAYLTACFLVRMLNDINSFSYTHWLYIDVSITLQTASCSRQQFPFVRQNVNPLLVVNFYKIQFLI
jgi:hypothetical protein